MATKYRVVQITGETPETFIVIGIDFEKRTITSTSESMREPEMRLYLEKNGASQKDMNSWIEQSRSYPGNVQPDRHPSKGDQHGIKEESQKPLPGLAQVARAHFAAPSAFRPRRSSSGGKSLSPARICHVRVKVA